MHQIRVGFVIALVLAASIAQGESRIRVVRPETLDRILMPFVGEAAVADQYWASQFWARNQSDRSITMFFPFPCQIGEGCGPLQEFELAPHQTFIDPTYSGARGVFLHVEKGAFRDLTYTLRVEDVAGLRVTGVVFGGTELPLVSADQFSSALTLLNVPVGGGARKLLRVYGSTAEAMGVTIRIYASQGDRDILLATQRLDLQAGRKESGYDAYPAFAVVDLTATIAALQNQAAQGRLAIQVLADGNAQAWAFLALLEPGDRSFTAITPGR